jgi:hypothetical protein
MLLLLGLFAIWTVANFIPENLQKPVGRVLVALFLLGVGLGLTWFLLNEGTVGTVAFLVGIGVVVMGVIALLPTRSEIANDLAGHDELPPTQPAGFS